MDAVRRAEFSEREREIIIKNKFVRRSSCLSLTHCLLLPSYQIQGAFLNSRTAHASLSTPCGTRFVQKSECKPIRRTGQRPPGLRCATMSLCAWIAWLQSTKRVNTLQSSKQRLGGREWMQHVQSQQLVEERKLPACFLRTPLQRMARSFHHLLQPRP